MALCFEMTFRARVFYCLQTAGSPFFTIFRSIFFHCRGSKGLSSRHDLLVDEAGNFGQFEFFSKRKKSTGFMTLNQDLLRLARELNDEIVDMVYMLFKRLLEMHKLLSKYQIGKYVIYAQIKTTYNARFLLLREIFILEYQYLQINKIFIKRVRRSPCLRIYGSSTYSIIVHKLQYTKVDCKPRGRWIFYGTDINFQSP